MLFQSKSELPTPQGPEKKEPSFLLVRGSVPTALQAMDRSTGENQRQCVHDNLMVCPELHRLCEGFPLRYRVSCTDRYQANYRCERGLCARDYYPELTWSHWPCDVRKAATVLSQALRAVPDDVSRLLNTGLAVGQLGSLKKLRDLLTELLTQQVKIRHELPPEDAKQQRDEIYSLFLPIDQVLPAVRRLNKKRRCILANYLNGRLWHDCPTHFCDIDCCASQEETLCNISLFVVWALLPRACPTMSRKGWVKQLPNADWVGLLESHHGLYSKLMLLHMGSPKRMEPQGQQSLTLPPGREDDWSAALQHALSRAPEEVPRVAAPVPWLASRGTGCLRFPMLPCFRLF